MNLADASKKGEARRVLMTRRAFALFVAFRVKRLTPRTVILLRGGRVP